MKKFIIVSTLFAMTGCTTINGVDTNKDQDGKQLVKTVATIAVVAAIAGAVGRSNQKSHCDNNRAGFWVDNVNHNVYTCP